MRGYSAAIMVLMSLATTGCYFKEGDTNAADKKVDAGGTCQAMGYAPGNAEYNHCVMDENAARMDKAN